MYEPNMTLFCPIEISPKFSGWLKRFISKNLIANRKTLHHEGKVFVEFIVNEDGSTSDFNVLKGLCGECDKRAVEVLQKMPTWTPGRLTKSGKAVRCRFVVPVAYRGD
jgi:protein TonB